MSFKPLSTFVYLHGLTSNPTVNRKAQELHKVFRKYNRVLATPDLRRNGAGLLSVNVGLEKLSALRQPDSSMGLVGSSMGAYTAALFASLQPPGVVRSMVLLNPAFAVVDDMKNMSAVEAARARADPKRWDMLQIAEELQQYDTFPTPPEGCQVTVIMGKKDSAEQVMGTRFYAQRFGEGVKLIEVDDGHVLKHSFPIIEREVVSNFDLDRLSSEPESGCSRSVGLRIRSESNTESKSSWWSKFKNSVTNGRQRRG